MSVWNVDIFKYLQTDAPCYVPVYLMVKICFAESFHAVNLLIGQNGDATDDNTMHWREINKINAEENKSIYKFVVSTEWQLLNNDLPTGY